MALVPVGHLDADTVQDWSTLQAQARSAVMRRLADAGIADLEKHLKFEVCYTPQDWMSLYNLAKGAAFGLSHNFMQVGYLRPQNRHRRYNNLYFVGSSTHPGTGLPMVLLSARLTTERILKELSVQHPVLNRRPEERHEMQGMRRTAKIKSTQRTLLNHSLQHPRHKAW